MQRRSSNTLPSRLAGAAAGAVLLASLGAGPAWAQPTAAPPAAAVADAPLAPTPLLAAPLVVTPPDAPAPLPAAPEASAFPPAASGAVRSAPAPSEAGSLSPSPSIVPFAAPGVLEFPPSTEFVLDHPQVIDTGRLTGGGRTVKLFGIVGVDAMASSLQAYMKGQGDRVSCQPHGPDGFTCLLPDRTDVALVALANGAAQTSKDAPEPYLAQEASAQAARRGIWSNLPRPPVTVSHPTARTSAILVSGDGTYVLYGLEGVAGRPASNLQSYIAAHGDSLLCQPQGGTNRYLCTLPDGTDIAKVALVNGAAHMAPDAPEDYRVQQAEAQQNHRGIWAARAQVAAPPAPAYGAPAYEIAPVYAAPPAYEVTPEDAQGPVAYLGGQPTAVIDGETVFLDYGAGLGWGYYDHFHHWRGAPERFARHLDRFHPEGRGFHGDAGHGPEFGGGRAGGREGAPGFHAGSPGFERPPGFREGQPGFRAERPMMRGEPFTVRGGPPQLPRGGPPGLGAPAFARAPVAGGPPVAGAPPFARAPGAGGPPIARVPTFMGAPAFAHPGPMPGFGRPAMPQLAAVSRPPVAAPARPPPPACAGKRC